MTSRIQSIVSALALIIVEFAAVIGLSLDTDMVVDILSGIAFVAALVYGIWKNHNFTDAAIEAQKLLNALKDDIPLQAGEENGEAYIEWRIPIAYGEIDEDR